MRLLMKSFFAAILSIVLAIPALAETRDVSANKSSAIGFYYTYAPDTCAYGSKSKFKVTQQPEHGTVTAKWQGFRMGKESRNCNGKQVYGMLVIYTPHKGFRGKDVVKFVLSGSNVYPGASYSLGRGYKVNLNVQ
jgi:hypothetical protein